MINVLIVEDDPMVAEINKNFLATIQGFHCVGVEKNVDNALHFLDNHSADLILLDIYMPEKDGLELLTTIRQYKKSIDVMIISAASDINTIKTALRLGAVDYLIKPFKYERLQSALSYYLEKQKIVTNKHEISQSELDEYILHPHHSNSARSELPKGLTKTTLQRIITLLFNRENTPFTTDDIAQLTDISRVSIRKYLKFLTAINLLSCELNYKQIGRPEYVYTLNQNNKQAVLPYIRMKLG